METNQQKTDELQAIFGNQYETGLLGGLTLNNLCNWIKSFAKVKIITIQCFGMIENRPDEWNVENYKKYLQSITSNLISQNAENLPVLLIITGPNGLKDPIKTAGRESVETALELEKMLEGKFKIKILPVGQVMENNGLDYVTNLQTAKQIIEQISQETDMIHTIDEFWTDSVRIWKHILCLMFLGMDFTKVKVAERIETNENGELAKNQNTWRQSGSIGIILGLLIQRFLSTKL